MRTATKKALSFFLTLVMVFTMVPAVSLTFTPKAQAAAFPTYTKNYDTEYYYPNGMQFIYQVATSSNPTASTAKTLLTSAGFTLLDIEFNKSVEGNYVYLGYTTTTDPLQACRALVVWDLTESADGFNYYVDKPFNGADRTFYMVGAGFDEHTPTAASGIVNLNDGCAAGSHEQFLFVTADRGAGLPITALRMAYGTNGNVWQNLTGAGYTVVHSFQSEEPEDLNEGTKSGHENLYLGYQTDPAITTVNSDRLRAAYEAASECYAKGGSLYEGLYSPLAAATAILNDLNDGYTIRNQEYIDAATRALYDAMPAMSVNSTVTLTVGSSAAKRWLKFVSPKNAPYIFYSCAASGNPKCTVYHRNDTCGLDPERFFTYASNDDVSALHSRMLGLNSKQFYAYTQSGHPLSKNETVYLCVEFPAGNAGSYPIRVCQSTEIRFNPTGGSLWFSDRFPAGQPLDLEQTGITRSSHTLAAWSANGEGYQDRCWKPGDTYTVPQDETILYARWCPDNPPTLALNTDYTATIDASGKAEYYLFTPSETGDYVLYGVNNTKRTCATLSHWADYPGTAGRIGGAVGNGEAALGLGSSDFCLRARLTAGTAYLFGVKLNRYVDTGSVKFRLERYHTVSFNANGGTGGTQTAAKYLGRNLALSGLTAPTREGYTLLGWSADSAATEPTYAANGVYTADADAALYAVWQRTPCTITLDANGGNNYSNTVSVTYGEEMPALNALPKREGYRFDGFGDTPEETLYTQFYYDLDGRSLKYWDKEGTTATLYARWTPLTWVETVDISLNKLPSYSDSPGDIAVQSCGDGCRGYIRSWWQNGYELSDPFSCGDAECEIVLSPKNGYWFPSDVNVTVAGARSVSVFRSLSEYVVVNATFDLPHDYSDWRQMTQAETEAAVSAGAINDIPGVVWDVQTCRNCQKTSYRSFPACTLSFAFNINDPAAVLDPIIVRSDSIFDLSSIQAPAVPLYRFVGWFLDGGYCFPAEDFKPVKNSTLHGKYEFAPDEVLQLGDNEVQHLSYTEKVCAFIAPADGSYRFTFNSPSQWNQPEEVAYYNLAAGETLSLYLIMLTGDFSAFCRIEQLTAIEEAPIVLNNAPQCGDNVDNVFIESCGAEYGVDSCNIGEWVSFADGDALNVGTHFKCGDVQTVFTLTAKRDYYFPDDVNVAVTGATEVRTDVSPDRRRLSVTADFSTHIVARWEPVPDSTIQSGNCFVCGNSVIRNTPAEYTLSFEYVVPMMEINYRPSMTAEDTVLAADEDVLSVPWDDIGLEAELCDLEGCTWTPPAPNRWGHILQ